MTPYTIQTMIEQMGGTGLTGALCYMGTRQIGYMHPPKYRDCECRPSEPSKITEAGLIDYQVGVSLRVNGKRGRNWTVVVTYECDDTYTVYLTQTTTPKVRETGKIGELLDYRRDVYFNELQAVCERMYDNAIKKYNGGFIPC